MLSEVDSTLSLESHVCFHPFCVPFSFTLCSLSSNALPGEGLHHLSTDTYLDEASSIYFLACILLQRSDLIVIPPCCLKVNSSLDALCKVVTALDASKTPAVAVLNGSCIGSGYALAMGKYK